MRVSVTLHSAEPPLDGNQRNLEAKYCGFNRAYADMEFDDGGNGTVAFDDLAFPIVQADPEILTHFSVGVCEAPPSKGGAIIITGPLKDPIETIVGEAPKLSARVGVFKARLDEMRATERLFDEA